ADLLRPFDAEGRLNRPSASLRRGIRRAANRMHDETALAKQLRFLVGLWLLLALCAAGGAAATPLQPVLTTIPFAQISAAAAKAAHQTPLCPPNGGTIVCYSPSFLRDAYDFPTGKNAPTGAGQTILIVTAYG